jgi:putative ABC transport system permease protein
LWSVVSCKSSTNNNKPLTSDKGQFQIRIMLKNVLKSTIRHLLRDKIYLLVSVLSLAAGLICCMFVFKYVQDELSYDQFHDDADRIYRIEYEAIMEDGFVSRFANLHGSVLPEQLFSLPEIDLKTRFARHAELTIEVNGEQFTEGNILAADSSFFDIFTFRFIEGNPEQAIAAPNSVVINQTIAQKYFKSTDAVGEVLIMKFQGQEVLLSITGVIEDVPSNAHFSFDIVTSEQVFENLYGWSLNEIQQAYSYVRIFDGVSADQLEKKIHEIAVADNPEYLNRVTYYLQALTDIHLHSSVRGELAANGNITTIYTLPLIALIILIIACVNFTTLATSRSLNRTNEIGIRKVFGALRSHLISSFLAEGVILSLCGLIIAWLLAFELLPLFNDLTGKSIGSAQLTELPFLLVMILTSFLIGCAAGIYPALILTKDKASSLLLKNSSTGFKGGIFWKGVIVSQFTTTIVLISASYVVHQQIAFIQNKDLGFDKEQIITFPNHFGENREAFINQLLQYSEIEHVAISSYIPGVSKTSGTAEVEAEDRTDALTFDWISVDHQYLDTYDISLKEGRNFSEMHPADAEQAFIINESAVKALGWEEPIGNRLSAFEREGQVIGVVEDFNFLSVHNDISPLLMVIYEPFHWTISAKIQSTEFLSETISHIENVWMDFLPDTPFTYNFVDDRFDAVYESEMKTRSIFFIFTMLAIGIATLGLFSFASFSMQQKTREIGIRKILGATINDILRHFYTGYFKLLMIAIAIALPVVLFWMNRWLQNFSGSGRMSPGADVFAVPLLISLCIILVSVSYHVIREGLKNPVETIRSE